MNENLRPSSSHAWLGSVVVGLLVAQLGLAWVQGRLLHRQHQDIQGLREDIQSLVESLDQDTADTTAEEGSLAPARTKHRARRGPRFARANYIAQEDSPDPAEQSAKKDLEESKQSAQKAVKDAREIQQKLSISENIRKADEKAKLERAQNAWQKWIWIGLGAGLVALVVRSWLRRRG